MVVGALVRSKVESNVEWLNKLLDESSDISALRRVSEKAEKLYLRTRNSASSQSARRAKEVVASRGWMQLHPIFGDEELGDVEDARAEMLAKISGFKPQETIFEVGISHKGKSTRNEAAEVMKTLRERYGARKSDQAQEHDGSDESEDESPTADVAMDDANPFDDESDQDMDDEEGDNDDDDDELEVTVSNHATTKKSHDDPSAWQDPEVFMSYTPRTVNAAEERGYGVHTGSYRGGAGFVEAARDATMDLTNDEGAKSFGVPARAGQRWDKKSGRYVNLANDADGSRDGPGGDGPKTRMIRGESGVKIAASFQSGRFDKWRRAQRIGRLPRVGEQERLVRAALPAGDDVAAGGSGGAVGAGPRYKHKQEKAPKAADKYRDDYEVRKRRVAEAKEKRVGRFRDGPGSRREVKSADDIRKARQLQEKRRAQNARPAKKGRGGKR